MVNASQSIEYPDRIIPRPTLISMEVVVYIALVVLALVLRVAQMDAVPMADTEARQALAAWRVVQPQTNGTLIVPESPILFALHTLSFSTLGASEFSSRLWTVLASIGLILTPILFRDLLGRGRSFLFSLLLAFSPVLLVSSRTDSSVIWTMLAGMVALWGCWRYYERREDRYGIVVAVGLTTAALLTGPTGIFFAVVLVGAGAYAFWMQGRDIENASADVQPIAVKGTFPWQSALLASVLVVFLVATLFMLYPAGLSAIGENLSASIRGLTTPRPYIPAFFPLLIILFYEPLLVVLGIAALAWRGNDDTTLADRYLTAWLILSVIFGIIYAGAGADHALWLTLPLAGLVSGLVDRLLSRVGDTLWWSTPSWSRWLVALVLVGLLGMFSIHIQLLARALLLSADTPLQLGSSNSVSVVWVIIIILFIIIGYFLSSSLWGASATTQGVVMGLMAFVLVTSLGAGWRAAVFNSDNPVEFWNRQAPSDETFLLRQTLSELSKRNTNGFPEIAPVVLAPDDGLVAWTLRDYPNTRFIIDAGAARAEPIVLLPAGLEQPDLGGGYVGHRYVISSSWDYRMLRLTDFLAWWLQRRTVSGSVPADAMTLWLRQDIYNGVPFELSQ